MPAKCMYPAALSLFILAGQLSNAQSPYCDQAVNLYRMASENFKQGKFEEAEPRYVRAIRYAIDGHCQAPTLLAPAMALASVLKKQGRYSDCETMLLEVQRAVDKMPGYSTGFQSAIKNNLADLYIILGKYADAVALSQQAVEMARKASGLDRPYLVSVATLAQASFGSGQSTEAASLFQRVLSGTEGKRGGEALAGDALTYLARIAEQKKDYAEAETLVGRARSILEAATGVRREEFGTALLTSARIARERGNPGDALPLCKQALDVHLELFGERHPIVGRDFYELGQILHALQNDREAELAMQKA
jgi:tetratricopeptide (TPR) repeat protein